MATGCERTLVEHVGQLANTATNVGNNASFANFSAQNKQMSYGDQAVEFAVDDLNEVIDENKIQNMDN